MKNMTRKISYNNIVCIDFTQEIKTTDNVNNMIGLTNHNNTLVNIINKYQSEIELFNVNQLNCLLNGSLLHDIYQHLDFPIHKDSLAATLYYDFETEFYQNIKSNTFNRDIFMDFMELYNDINTRLISTKLILHCNLLNLNITTNNKIRSYIISQLTELFFLNYNRRKNIKSVIFLDSNMFIFELNIEDKVKINNYIVTPIMNYKHLNLVK